MTYIPYHKGKVYDIAHLRPFNFELAKAGNPLATYQGEEIRLLRDMDGAWRFDVWRDSKWTARTTEDLDWLFRLAPLAVKDGRPLHVGDVIEFEGHSYLNEWFTKIFELKDAWCITNTSKFWRFPKD